MQAFWPSRSFPDREIPANAGFINGDNRHKRTFSTNKNGNQRINEGHRY